MEENSTRDSEILRARIFDGKTYDAIAKDHGLSKERVRQILAKAVRLNEHSKIIFKRQSRRISELQREIVELKSDACSCIEGKAHEKQIELASVRLSARTFNCLVGEKIYTLNEARRISDDDLLKIPSFGRKSLRELRMAISEHLAPNP